jgi:hypothetical protein
MLQYISSEPPEGSTAHVELGCVISHEHAPPILTSLIHPTGEILTSLIQVGGEFLTSLIHRKRGILTSLIHPF